MGMFDIVLIDTECPQCNHVNFESQTKDGEQSLMKYEVGDEISDKLRYIECYHICDKCDRFYEFKLEVDKFGLLTSNFKGE